MASVATLVGAALVAGTPLIAQAQTEAEDGEPSTTPLGPLFSNRARKCPNCNGHADGFPGRFHGFLPVDAGAWPWQMVDGDCSARCGTSLGGCSRDAGGGDRNDGD